MGQTRHGLFQVREKNYRGQYFIKTLEQALGKSAEKNFLGMQARDVPVAMADIESTRRGLGWQPKTSINEGLNNFAKWFLEYVK